MIDFAQTLFSTIPDQVTLDKSDSFSHENTGLISLDPSFDSMMNPPTSWQHSVQMSLLGVPNTTTSNGDWGYVNTGSSNNLVPETGYSYQKHDDDAKNTSSADSVASLSDQQSNYDDSSPNNYEAFDTYPSIPMTHRSSVIPTPQRTQTESVWQRRLQSHAKQANLMDLRRTSSDQPVPSMYPADPQGTDAALAFQQFPAPFGIPHQQLQQASSIPPPPPAFQDNSGSYPMSQINQVSGVTASRRNNGDDISVHSARYSPYGHESSKDASKTRRRVRGGIGKSSTVEETDDLKKAASSKGVISKVVVPAARDGTDSVDLRTGEAGSMRHMCPFEGCDKHFSTSGHARRHSRIHDCLRPFECPHDNCNATFTRRDNCTQHQRARHQFQLVAHRLGQGEERSREMHI